MIRLLANFVLDALHDAPAPASRVTGRQAAALVDKYGLKLAVAYLIAARKEN